MYTGKSNIFYITSINTTPIVISILCVDISLIFVNVNIVIKMITGVRFVLCYIKSKVI